MGCEGAIVDSGASAADYGANENHSITWCAEDPETILNMYWVVFVYVMFGFCGC